jgi:predicted nucleic acid-binding protein
MTEKYFIDSNVWLYLFVDSDSDKKARADTFLSERTGRDSLFTSWQVVNEVWNNLLRKGKSDEVAREMAEHILLSCQLVDFSYALLVSAHGLRLRNTLHFWDSLIIAAALESDSDTLVSEDMQHGRTFGRLTVRNIFKDG